MAPHVAPVFVSKLTIIRLLCAEANPRDKLLQHIISFQLFLPEKSLTPKYSWFQITLYKEQVRTRWLVRKTLWYYAILPAKNIGLNYQIWKQIRKQIQKANLFVYDWFHMHFGIGKFCITCRKVIMTIELQYYVA